MKILEKEIWRDIPNYEGYQVSNLGRVKSLERLRKGKNDSLVTVKEKILKQQLVCGYYQIGLHKNSKVRFYLVHRLVWFVFNGQIPEDMQVNHINEIKSDNRLSNLNLMTAKENINWGTGIERCAKKRINGKCSKSVLQFTLEDVFIKEYPSTHQAERETGFNNGNISACCRGERKTAHGFKWKYKN